MGFFVSNDTLNGYNSGYHTDLHSPSDYTIYDEGVDINYTTLGYEIVGRELYETLDVDYQLYKKIVEVNNGYHVTKNDKEQGVLFVEFIDKLLLNGNMENELLIEDKRDNRKFSLIYENDFDEEFIFERMES